MKNSASSANSPNKNFVGPLTSPSIPIELRVRYSETDRMGVAHNKNYFEWFELGRTEFCRQQGISYKDIEERGYYLVVVESFCRYKRPLHYDECFLVWTSLRNITPKKAVFVYELKTREGQTLIAEGYTVHIAVDRNRAVSPLPGDIVEKMKPPS